MKQCNVLMIMNYAAAYRGNFISCVMTVVKKIESNGGTAVCLFPAAARQREWAKQLEREGNTVYFLRGSPVSDAALIRRITTRHSITMVHTHFIDASFYVPLRAATLFKNIPHIFHAHSVPHTSENPAKLFFKRLLLNPSLVVCVSQSVREKYERLGFKCETVENGIDFSRLDSPASPHTFALSGTKAVLMLGYDVHIKGIDTAVLALTRFDSEHRFTLGICVASHTHKVQQCIAELSHGEEKYIRILPPTENIAEYYAAADIFLSAIRTEGMPYAVCEAAYCGKSAVLSDIPQHTSLLIPGAVFFPAEDSRALFDALMSVRQSDALSAEQNTQAARAYISERFSTDEWADKIISVYYRFLHGSESD